MSSGDGRVRREDDLALDLLDVAVALLAQQLEREEAGVALVEVEGPDVAEAEVAQYAQAADAEYQLLAEARSVSRKRIGSLCPDCPTSV